MKATDPVRKDTPAEQSGSGNRWSRVRAALRSPRAWLFLAIVGVLLIGMLAGSTGDGPFSRWFGGIEDSEQAASDSDDSSPPGDSGERDMVDGGEDPDAPPPGAASGSGSSDSGDDSGGSGADGTAAGQGADGTAAGQDAGGATDSSRPPSSSTQPPPASNPVAILDETFGESMFPGTYPGLEQVNVFDDDEGEVTATYKNIGQTDFDIVRITVQQTDSAAEVQQALALVRTLFPADSISYGWGGREIVQASDASLQSMQSPAFNFSWTQGRYAIDVTVHSPYSSGAAAARQAALEFIGRLDY